MAMGLVSVVIPAYNAERTIHDTIESALAQTYREIEVIVVDDGSTDDTAREVAAFGDRVRYVHQAKAGAASARNFGIAIARGDYVALLDADDLWLPEKLERQLAFLAVHPEVGAVQCGARFVDDTRRTLEIRRCRHVADPLWEVLHFRNLPAFLSALLMRRSCLEHVGPFDTSLVILEEWDMAIKTARFCGLASLPEPLVLYRVHRANRSRDVDIHVAPGFAVLERLYADPDLPARVRAARREVYGSFFRMLAGGYFGAGQFVPFVRWTIRAVRTDPGELFYMAALPLRRLRRLATRLGAARRTRRRMGDGTGFERHPPKLPALIRRGARAARDGSLIVKLANRFSKVKFVPPADWQLEQDLAESFPEGGWKRLSHCARRMWLDLGPLFEQQTVHAIAYVGANVGDGAFAIDEAFPGRRFYLFEPLPWVFRALAQRASNRTNFVCVNAAAGSAEDRRMMFADEFTPASSLLPYTTQARAEFPFLGSQTNVDVRVAKLDDLLREIGAKSIDLLIMDVQGFEDEVLRGAQRTLRECKAVMSELSVEALYVGSSTFDSVYQRLRGEGFLLRWLLNPMQGKNRRIVQIDGVFIRGG